MRGMIIIGLIGLGSLQASANSFGLKAGLWETRIVKMTVDGQDKTGAMSEASSRMQAAMANMPPEQRARMEAMMKERGGGSTGTDGTTRICISEQLANSDKPFSNPSKDEQCQPASITRSGNRTTYSLTCTAHGQTSTGKGEAIVTGDMISTKVDMTTKSATGETHERHIETEMKFLGTDCGGLTPIMPPKSAQ